MQETLAADPESIQQIDFTWKLEQDGNTTMPFIIEEVKKKIFWISHEKLWEDLLEWIYFALI